MYITCFDQCLIHHYYYCRFHLLHLPHCFLHWCRLNFQPIHCFGRCPDQYQPLSYRHHPPLLLRLFRHRREILHRLCRNRPVPRRVFTCHHCHYDHPYHSHFHRLHCHHCYNQGAARKKASGRLLITTAFDILNTKMSHGSLTSYP